MIKKGLDPNLIKAQERKLKPEIEALKIKSEFWHNILSKHIFCNHFYVFFITAVVALSGVMFSILSNSSKDINEYWKIIMPIITTYMGFAIGKKVKTDKN